MFDRILRPWLGILAIAAGVLAVSACSTDGGSTVAAPPTPPATAQPATVIGETQVETEATVLAIDRTTRDVTLRMADGSTQTVTAPADADLSRVKTGDVVILAAFQRISVTALPPGSAPLGATLETSMAKAQPGQTPGRIVAGRTTVVTEVTAVDVVNNTVTLKGANSSLRTLDVKNPDNQRKLTTLKAGDLVQFEVIEAAAIALRPKA